jgi:hypothetical protein
MTVDICAAERFVLANGRLLDRHRLAALLHDAPTAPVLDTLRAYRNRDGGFGHALEPDVRAAASEPASTLHALEVLAEIDALDDPMLPAAAAWIASIADPEGGVPFVLPSAADSPRAPWMVPSDGGSFLTFAITAVLSQTRWREPWLQRANGWCWAKLDEPDELTGYWVKFALGFLDRVPEAPRANATIERLRAQVGTDGSIPVPGGAAEERLTPLMLSVRPGARSRALFTDAQIEAGLAALEAGQQDDGGWTFDWLAWSLGQALEWRGIVTLRALVTLRAHGRGV